MVPKQPADGVICFRPCRAAVAVEVTYFRLYKAVAGEEEAVVVGETYFRLYKAGELAEATVAGAIFCRHYKEEAQVVEEAGAAIYLLLSRDVAPVEEAEAGADRTLRSPP